MESEAKISHAQRFLLLCGILSGLWSGLDAPKVEAGLDTPWLGVRERIFWYSYQLWFAVLALALLRERRPLA